jgi:hypothetical protein
MKDNKQSENKIDAITRLFGKCFELNAQDSVDSNSELNSNTIVPESLGSFDIQENQGIQSQGTLESQGGHEMPEVDMLGLNDMVEVSSKLSITPSDDEDKLWSYTTNELNELQSAGFN